MSSFLNWLKSRNKIEEAAKPFTKRDQTVWQHGSEKDDDPKFKHYGIEYVAETSRGKYIRDWGYSMGKTPNEAIEEFVEYLKTAEERKGGPLSNVYVINIKRVPAKYASQFDTPANLKYIRPEEAQEIITNNQILNKQSGNYPDSDPSAYLQQRGERS